MTDERGAETPSDRRASDNERRRPSWDVQKAPRNYLALIATQVSGTCAAFAAVWLASRLLGPSRYGMLVAVIAASSLVMQFAVHWTAASVTRFGVEEFVRSGVLGATFWTRAAVLAVKLVLVVATSRLWFPSVAAWFHLVAADRSALLALVAAIAIWVQVQQTLQAVKLPRLQGGLLMLERLVIVALLIILSRTGAVTPNRVLIAYIIAPLAMTCIGLVRLRHLIVPVRVSRDMLGRMFRFSLPLIPTGIIGYLATSQLDAIFLLRYLSAAELGRYAIASQTTGAFTQIPFLAGSLALPLLVSVATERRDARLAGVVREVLPALTLAWSLLCIVLALASYHLLPLVFGPRFEASAPLFWPLMAVAALAGPVLMGLFPLAHARSMTYVVAVNALLGAIANVAFDILLIPRYGLLGCAWATVLASICSLLWTSYIINRKVLGGTTWVVEATLAPLLTALLALRLPSNIAATMGVAMLCLQGLARRRSLRVAFDTIVASRLTPAPTLDETRTLP